MNVKKFFITMLITILVAGAISGGLTMANYVFDGNLSGKIAAVLDKATSNKANILLMGLDEDRIRADVIMVVSLDPDENTIDVLSIPRDTRVEYGPGKYDKINHAMGYKNPEEKIISLVKEITGMPIHYYCEVSFEGFRNVIDILDGVEFDVPMDMHYDDPAQNLSIHVNKGLQILNGKDAEGVVRYRAGYATGDMKRISVQQDFLMALFEQKLKPSYIRKAPALFKEISDHVTTNFGIGDATKYIKMLKRMEAGGLETHMLPGGAKYIGGGSYYVYDPAETRQLILTQFGYPEDEAKALKEQEGNIGLVDEE